MNPRIDPPLKAVLNPENADLFVLGEKKANLQIVFEKVLLTTVLHKYSIAKEDIEPVRKATALKNLYLSIRIRIMKIIRINGLKYMYFCKKNLFVS